MALAFARASARACVCVCGRIRARVQRGSVVPAVLLFGTARRVNPGQCGKKATRSASSPHELRSRDEARRNARTRGRVRGRRKRREGRRRRNVHGVSHTHALTRSRIHVGGNAFAMRTTVERRVRCQTRLRLLGSLARMRASFTRDVKFQDSLRSRHRSGKSGLPNKRNEERSTLMFVARICDKSKCKY